MRSLRYAFLPALLAGSFLAQSQEVHNAFDFSYLTVQGTARSMGFGNALGSVGGDFSAISVNPAGLGVYRSSELTFTPSLRINGAASQYIGATTNDNNTHFNINNFGIVFTSAPKGARYERRNWKAVSFAFGMNRTADFNQTYSYKGKNTLNSGSQAFESDANRFPDEVEIAGPYSELGYMGYWSYLLNKNSMGQYYSIVPFQGGVDQYKSIQTNGGINEYLLSLGGNYKEKLMLGISIGIPSLRYERTAFYQETISSENTAANPYNFQSFTYNQAWSLSGIGVNAKLGAIYKVNDAFRVGASFHSPSYYAVSDVFTPSMNVQGNGVNATLVVGDYPDGNHYLQQNQYDYTITTPWKAVASATYLFKRFGFITADYEFVNYAAMRFHLPADENGYSSLDVQNAKNQQIKNTYKAASNVRLGAEARLGKVFMLRAGFGYYGNPYKTGNDNAQRMDISGGFGFRFKHFFTDLALVHSMYQLQSQPYTVDYGVYSGYPSVVSGAKTDIPVATTDYSLNNVALTVGVKF